MKVRVLGSAAGGGFPQWNCGCPNCVGVRRQTIPARPRGQEAVVVSADGAHWFLLNAPPEIATQLQSFEALHPRSLRDCPLAGILVSNGDLDHCLGLLSLRESQPLRLYATARVRAGFTEHNRLYRTLSRFDGHIGWQDLRLGAEQALPLPNGDASGLSVRAVAMPGNGPLHLRELGYEAEDNVGFLLRDHGRGKSLAYLPAVAAITPEVKRIAVEADAIFLDGTFWSSDELIALGIGDRRAEDMSHCPIAGPSGSLAWLRTVSDARRFYIHINNTNPILREDSPEHRAVVDAGIQIAHDGLELTL